MEEVGFWKLGCVWDRGRPSFYHILKENKLVIGHSSQGFYSLNDIVLITDGFKVIALGKIIGAPMPANSNSGIRDILADKEVDDFDNISFYNVDFYELPEAKQFEYQLQSGIRHVRKEEIILHAKKLWNEYRNDDFQDNRLMRLTWNKNNWEFPSGHQWRPEDQNSTTVAYEKQYGYGYEEWLFSERFRIDGYQYGYIRGVENISNEISKVDQITLYTIKDDKKRCLIGNLFDVELIAHSDNEQKKIQDLSSTYEGDMIEELKKVGADFNHFQEEMFVANVKFKWDKTELFNHPMPANFLNERRFNRFQAYKLDNEILEHVNEAFKKKSKFEFISGKANNTAEYIKTSSQKKIRVRRRHGEITDDLYDYLKWQGRIESNISVEKTRVGGAIVDVVLKLENNYEIFEIKTCSTALKNIRQALGQIFEYALIDGEANCRRLVIIGPAKMSTEEKEYFTRLKDLISIKLEYWEHKGDEKSIENKFITE